MKERMRTPMSHTLSRRSLLQSTAGITALGAAGLVAPAWTRAALQAEEEGQFGGKFTAAVQTPPPTLDVHTNLTSATREVTWFTLETLVSYGEDYALAPVLAESWETSEDGLSVNFKLREGVTFQNGKEMTSEDVVASMTRFLEVTPRAAQFAMLDTFEAVDPYNVRFDLKYPSLAFLDSMALPFCYVAIFPKEIIEGKEADALELSDIVGTGPYKLVDWQPDQYSRFERYEEYVSLDEPRSGMGGGKVPYFDEIELIPVTEVGARIAGLETGEFDFAAAAPTTDYDALNDNDDTMPVINPYFNTPCVLFNHRNELSSNLQFRQAIQALADMDAISMAITNGKSDFFTVQPSLWFPVSPWFNEAGAELYNQKNPEKAKELLDASGYAGEEVVLVTNRNYDYMFKLIVALEEQMKSQLGMNTRVDVVDWPAQNARWEEPDTWQISTTGWVSQALFAPDAFGAFYAEGSNAGAGYNNPDMIAAFDAALAAATVEDRLAAYADVQRIYHEDAAGLKICDNTSIEALRSDIHDYATWYQATRFWSVWRES
ncbi:MAG: hypothetical protein KC438_09055 [Thermomicrobiales bacterium]|nr:hypothetical protein [Thermomicrobiales bacterium]